MKFLVVGLGSMGKRRIRCLKALGYPVTDIAGFDFRDDRQQEAARSYGINTFADFSVALRQFNPDALIISVPPDIHHEYMKAAIRARKPFFVEASVVDTDMESITADAHAANVIAAPSSTLLFHPAIKAIAEIVKAQKLGKVSNVILHSGQYLPDWHTYEAVSDYYVSNPATGGGREIVPFELSWFVGVFGFPQRICGNFRKTIEIKGAECIDDTYNFLMDYGTFLASITVDVVSRHATRRLLINGSEKQLVWDWDEQYIRLYSGDGSDFDTIHYDKGVASSGYNSNIGETMYIDELKAFIDAVSESQPFVNTLENDHRVLKLLYAIEQADKSGRYIEIAP